MSYSILIIDCSTTTRALLKHTVRQTEFGRGRIHEAATADEAMEVLENHRVDLVLIDPNLDGVNGMDLIGRIAAEPETRNVPVVVMTARPEPRKDGQLRRAGVRAQIRKPFSPEAFAEVAAQVLEPTHV